MAGEKPKGKEKEQIIELLRMGHKPEEIKETFPHLDGRSIAGLLQGMRISEQKLQERMELKQRGVPQLGSQDRQLTGGLQPIAPATEPDVLRPPQIQPTPMPPDKLEEPVPQENLLKNLGFSSIMSSRRPQTGFLSTKSEYFLVERIDGPRAGALRREYPPFNMEIFLSRYPAGTFRIRQYRNGIMVDEAIETISPDAKPESAQVTDGTSPHAMFLNATKAVAEIQEKAEARVKATNDGHSMVTTAIDAMGRIVEKTSNNGIMGELFKLMSLKEDHAAEAHKRDMERLREENKAMLERERERLRIDRELAEKRMNEDTNRSREYLAKLHELNEATMKAINDAAKIKDEVRQEYFQRMLEQLNGVQESLKAEREQRLKHLDEIEKTRLNSLDREIELKRKLAGDQRTDMLMKTISDVGGKIEGILRSSMKPVNQAAAQGTPPQQAPALVQAAIKSFNPKDAVKEPWFLQVIDQAVGHVSEGNPGSMAAQVYIDKLNMSIPEDSIKLRMYYTGYIAVTPWKKFLEDAKEAISEEQMKVLNTDAAETWYKEFKHYMQLAWKQTAAS